MQRDRLGGEPVNFELVAGLETHIELSTKSKLFCFCANEFGAEPNTRCCPVCIGLPGTLPRMNKQAVYFGVMAGLALNCRINNLCVMERKNYSYPDLPKAYQITQLSMPLCEDGYLELSSGKKIRIARIQVEEDAGKLVHSEDEVYVDYNRCGVPLIEIVSEPDISSVEEAREYVEKLRLLMRYIGISDCRMQEGSMRFDVNVSVKKPSETKLGERTEIKNMNSVSAMVKAMEHEYNRQTQLLLEGRRILRETLRFDEVQGVTLPMRSKEDAQDYRFFREPDLLSVVLSDTEIDEIKSSMPVLPWCKAKKYISEYGISPIEAEHLTKYRKISEFYDETINNGANPRIASKFIIGQIFSLFTTESEKEEFLLSITSTMLSELCVLLEKGKISKNLAKVTLDKMLSTGKAVTELISEEDMKTLSTEELFGLCKKTLAANTPAVKDYKRGKEKALMALLGAVMRESRGKADPEHTKRILMDLLSED